MAGSIDINERKMILGCAAAAGTAICAVTAADWRAMVKAPVDAAREDFARNRR